MDRLRTDLRFAIRQLARSPGFAFLAILTLALGLGVNTSLYTVAEAILRRPRPGVGESSALIWIGATTRERSRPTGVSYQVAARLREEIPLLEHVVTVREMPLSISTREEPLKITGQAVSGDYFTMLRTPFALGRGFSPAEDSIEGAHPVVVLNHRTWQSSFGSDPGIVGRTISLNGMPFTVLGVTTPDFNGAEQHDQTRAVWVPSTMLGTLLPAWRWMVTDASNTNIRVLARMRSTSDREAVNSAVQRISALIAAADTSYDEGWTLRTYNAAAGIPAGGETQVVPVAALSFAVTGLILLICCANVSNLMLARALSRQREIATRLSIGASRWRVVQQLLTEAVVLATLAGGGGLLFAAWGTEAMIAFALPLELDVSVDWRVFGVSAALALAAGVLFGLAPALHATRDDVALVLRRASTGGDRRRSRLQGGLVVAQVALSLMLLTMSGLFVRSLDKARRIDVGFDASAQVLAMSYDVGLQRYDSARSAEFTEQLLARARALPGVESVTATSLLPLTEWSTTSVVIEEPTAVAEPNAYTTLSSVAPRYFRTIATSLQSGRDFNDADAGGAPPVAIVSESFVRQFLGDRSALGARIRVGGERAPWRTVVGVARDAIVSSLNAPGIGAVYLPLRQHSSNQITLLVRATGSDASALSPALRDAIRSLDPFVPVYRQLTLDVVREQSTREQGIGAIILAVFGTLALALASLGLHGVLLYTVRQRTREIGIRMALGATRRSVIGLVVRRGMRLTLVGGSLGIVLALGGTQLTRSFIYGVSPSDAITFAVVSALFALVALLACWVPARRAANVDPTWAMKAE
jgi:predicted permease